MAEAELTGRAPADAVRSGRGGLGFVPSLAAFVRDLGRYARRDALLTGLLVAVGAVVDSVGLVLLIPLLGVVAPSTRTPHALQHAADAFFGVIGAQKPLERLAALLAVYGALMVTRAVVTTTRDVKLAQLQIGFLESQRA
jgi:ATP-binding cassette, subfamily C, bacterial